MNVGVRAGERIPAMLATATRLRIGTRAEQPLTEPEGETLLPYAGRTVEEQRTRKRVATNGIVEASAQHGVAMQWKKGHADKVDRFIG